MDDSGGPAGLAYGFLIAWFSSLSVYLVIAEMASMLALITGCIDRSLTLRDLQSSYCRRTILLGLNAGPRQVQKIR